MAPEDPPPAVPQASAAAPKVSAAVAPASAAAPTASAAEPKLAPTRARSTRPRRAPRRAAAAAMLGSVAALGGAGSASAQPTRHPAPDRQRRQSSRPEARPAGEQALLAQVFSALSGRAPELARPILAGGVAAGTITAAQEDRFLARLESVGGPERPTPAAPPPGPEGQALFGRVFAAIQAELPLIALPLVMAAVAEGAITETEAARLRARLRRGPQLGFGLVMRNARAAGATRLP